MDLYCPRCGEPWDFDSLHDEAAEQYGIPYYRSKEDERAFRVNPDYVSDDYRKVYERVASEFRINGCAALPHVHGPKPCKPQTEAQKDRAALASVAYELLGDDMDGAASELDDWLR